MFVFFLSTTGFTNLELLGHGDNASVFAGVLITCYKMIALITLAQRLDVTVVCKERKIWYSFHNLFPGNLEM